MVVNCSQWRRYSAIILTLGVFLALPLGLPAGSAWALSWQFLGPEPITQAQANFNGYLVGPTFHASGRVTTVAADPATSGRVFVGTANGGLWVVTGANGSSPSYTRISDTLPNPTQAIGAIALDTTTSPPTVYVGTGEGNFCADCYYGRGLFYSTNLGATWNELFPSDFEEQAFTKLVLVNSSGTEYLFAGVTQGFSTNRNDNDVRQSTATKNGLWRIKLGNTPVDKHYTAATFGNCTTPANGGNCPADDIAAITVSGSYDIFVGIDGNFSSGGGGLYESTDIGTTWTPVLTAGACAGLSPCPTSIGRISLAGSGSTVYAMIGAFLAGGGAGPYPYAGFYHSANLGTSWSQMSVPC